MTAVVRCECHDVSLAAILDKARREGLSFDNLRSQGVCCNGCALCEPYVRLTLATGQAQWPVLSAAEIAARLTGPAPANSPAPRRTDEAPHTSR